MRGASAVQDVLSQHHDAKARVFAVWEPILFTDWRKPGADVLARFSDSRVMEIWDRQHLVAKHLAKDARPPQPEPQCCTRNGVLWDLVAVYPPDAVWTEAMPPAVLFDGPVVHKQTQIGTALQDLREITTTVHVPGEHFEQVQEDPTILLIDAGNASGHLQPIATGRYPWLRFPGRLLVNLVTRHGISALPLPLVLPICGFAR